MLNVSPKTAGDQNEAFPFHGGEMGSLIRAFDFSKTSLGPISGWPAHLRITVGLMLPAKAQIVLFWGSEFLALYNDAYAPTIGNKHPTAFARPARESWTELWSDLEPLLTRVLLTGETVSAKDRPFNIERHGYPEPFTSTFPILRSLTRQAESTAFCASSKRRHSGSLPTGRW